MPTLIGKEIGKYRITKHIGRGGMADVYMGIHTYLERQVAIKVLHSYLLEEGGNFIERFKREAKAVANLRHPNIVQIYDFDIQGDLIFMVMDFVDGINLQKMLEQLDKEDERLPTKLIGSIINDIAKALDYAHSQGILHRDVKPSNILIDKDGKAYLMDFGIARIVGNQKLTATGSLIGTPAYMSPEQGRSEELTKESDIYSLGIVAFEMLTGKVPYDGQTPIGIIHKQITEPIPDIGDFVEDIPNIAQNVIDKVLAKSPSDRYYSADELAVALSLLLQSLESAASSQQGPARKTGDLDEEALFAPTVEIQDVATTNEFDQLTAVMYEDNEPKQKQEDNSFIVEKEIEEAQVTTNEEKRKIPLWGVIAVVMVLFGAATIVIPWVMGATSQPTSEDETPSVVQTEIIDLPQSKPESIAILATMTSSLPEPTPTLAKPSPTLAKPTSTPIPGIIGVVFDADHTDSGLILQNGGDWDVYEVTIGEDQERAWRTGNGKTLPSSDNNQVRDVYMGFFIENDSLNRVPLGTQVRIEVDYLDEGFDSFEIQYDAHSGGQYGDGKFKNSEIIQKTNSGEVRTAVFELDDAFFDHRNNGADFRIDGYADGAETICRVRVMLFP